MTGGISAPFIRYPIGTSLLMAGILFVGLVAYPLLPVAPQQLLGRLRFSTSASQVRGCPTTSK